MSDLKACIFDLDGVLVDTAKYHFIAWQRLANSLDIDFDEHDNEQLKGLSRTASLDYILLKANRAAGIESRENWMEQKNNWYLELISKMEPSELLPNTQELLEDLKRNRIGIALGSASKNAQFILERTNILNYFDEVIDAKLPVAKFLSKTECSMLQYPNM